MKRTHPHDWKRTPDFGYGEPVPMTDTQIVPVPTEPKDKVPDAVIIQRIPQHGPLPGELPAPSNKRPLN